MPALIDSDNTMSLNLISSLSFLKSELEKTPDTKSQRVDVRMVTPKVDMFGGCTESDLDTDSDDDSDGFYNGGDSTMEASTQRIYHSQPTTVCHNNSHRPCQHPLHQSPIPPYQGHCHHWFFINSDNEEISLSTEFLICLTKKLTL